MKPTTLVPDVPPPLYLCRPFVEAALVKGDFHKLVRLPKGVDDHEWVALNSGSSRLEHICGSTHARGGSSVRFLQQPELVLRCRIRILYA
jgi:hypothetical protein